MDVHEGNPFVIRDSINWRDVRREDQLLELEIRRAERKKPVHEQHTYVTRTMGGNIPRIRQEIARMCSVLTSDDTLYPGPQKNKGIDKSPLDSMNQRDRQNPHQLIESKREIFHLEFALRTRRDEISKLRLRALLFDLKVCFLSYYSENTYTSGFVPSWLGTAGTVRPARASNLRWY